MSKSVMEQEAEQPQDDEEFEQLLDEIPRATSAPPHLEELQRVYGAILDDSPFVVVREDEVAVKPFADIRLDEDYEEFYKVYSGVKKLPPPMGNRQLYTDSPKAMANQLSPFFSGLGLDSSSPRHSFFQRSHHQEQEREQFLEEVERQVQKQRQQQQQKQQQEQQQQRRDEQALSSAFGGLSFGEASSGRKGSSPDRGDRRGGGQGRLGPLDPSHDSQALGGGRGNGEMSRTRSRNGGVEQFSSAGYGSNGQGSLENLLGRGGMGSAGNGSVGMYAKRPPAADGMGLDGVGGSMGGGEGGMGMGMGMATSGVGSNNAQQMLFEQFLRSRAAGGVDLYGTGGGALGGVGMGGLIAGTNPRAMGMGLGGLGLDALGLGGSSLDAYSAAAALQAARMFPGGAPAAAAGFDVFSAVAGLQPAMPLDYDMATLLQMQQVRAQQMAALQAQTQRLQAQMEEERLRQQRQQLQQQILLQQHQAEAAQQQRMRYGPLDPPPPPPPGGAFLRGQSPANAMPRQPSGNPMLPQSPKPALSRPTNSEENWKGGGGGQVGGVCRYYMQGFCSRGAACPFSHGPSQGGRAGPGAGDRREARLGGAYDRTPPRGRSGPAAAAAGQQRRRNAEGVGGPPADVALLHGDLPERFDAEGRKGPGAGSASSGGAPQQQAKYTTLEEVEGRIYSIAKDQHGCRFLQRKFDEGGVEDVAKIFREIVGHMIELMTDPFGNYLVQKLLEVCTEEQRREILHRVTAKGDLVTISLNMHGTRAVQKLIETLHGSAQVSMVTGALGPGVVALIKDLNGNHVVQRCLQRLSNEECQFIFDAAAAHCIEIATHRHGCCVLQRCIDFASGQQRERLVAEVAANSLILSQDPFGNYVVQYILDLNLQWTAVEVMVRLEGNYAFLAQQKFSSNVVERCLKLAGEEHRNRLVRELIASPRLGQLLQDPFANYVFQAALTIAKGALHAALVEAVKPHVPSLKSSPYGKRILSRMNLRK